MMQRTPVNPGTVEWTGENPGIYLKESPDSDWTTLGIFFRVALSPHGRGHTMIVLERPDLAAGYPEVANLCLTDNDALTQYLVENFMAKFPTFKGKAGLTSMSRLPLTSVNTGGDMKISYSETAIGDGVEIAMTWKHLGEPFAAEVTKDKSATGEHEMYSVFFEAGDAFISVNGRTLAGHVASRQFFGRTMSTAFLAVSETWVKPAA